MIPPGASPKVVLSFQVTAEQVVAAVHLLFETLKHLAAADKGLVSVEVHDIQACVVAVLCLEWDLCCT